LRADDDAEFTAFVERQSRFAFRVAYAVLRNAQDAEDAAQEMFFKLYRSAGWRAVENERAFLARAVWRISIDRLRQQRVKNYEDSDTFELPSHGPSPEQSAIAADWHGTIHRLIDRLPEELRQPLALSTVDEMNSREIAAVMGIPEGTVRTRLMRARELLKKKLLAMEERSYARQRC
jgi:RNA polymerase sigma-70 factor (ECF subfamily)